MTAGCGIVYDAVFSLGQWCATAIVLKKLGLRSASGPFDWTGLTGRVGNYVDLMTNGFRGYFAKESLRKVREDPVEGTEIYVDTVHHWESHHDFRIGVSFEENYARYRARLDRRADRLLTALRSGCRLLFVHWFGEGRYPREEVVSAVRRLRAAHPSTRIDLLVLETEKFSKGVGYEEPEEGVMFAVGDFYDQERFDAVVGNEALVVSVLRRIRMRGRWRNLLRVRVESLRKRIRRVLCRAGRKGGAHGG